MNKMSNGVKAKVFYAALGVGVVMFASLVAVYNYKDAKKKLASGQAIDLNQPIDEQIAGGTDGDKKDTAKSSSSADKTDKNVVATGDMGKNNKDKVESGARKEEAKDSTTEIEGKKEAAACAGAANEKKLEYNGEQELSWPLVGDVILPYSMDTTVYFQTLNAYKCNPGMLIMGNEGVDVVAAFAGRVSKVYETKERGTVVEIDLGNGYMATYGQLMNVCVKEGAYVSKDQVIAEVGPVSSYYTEEGTHLYFQISKDKKPVNPMTLIK